MLKTILANITPPFLLSRARFAGLAALALVGLWWPLRSASTPPKQASEVGPEAALVAALEEWEALKVSPGGARYLEDPLARPWSKGLGYVPALAVGSREGAVETSDVYYLEVRTDAHGTPLAIRRMNNITRTPHADEALMALRGTTALLSVEVFGQLQSILVVDISKDDRDTSVLETEVDRWRYRLTNLQKTGRSEGVGLRIYSLSPPPERLEIEGSGQDLKVKLIDKDGYTAVALAAETAELNVAEKDRARVTYQPRFFAAKGLVPWLVDTIRDLSWVGPKKIAVLEQFVFHWKDRIKQGAFALGLVSGEGNLAEELGTDGDFEEVEMVFGPEAGSGQWPPPDVVPGVSNPAPGEGEWTVVKPKWLRTLPGAPPAFLKTAVRMDPDRPYDNIVLIAMDMRQMDLGLVAGTVTPESSFGIRGDGLMSRDPEVVDRLVGAFNGGFKTAHGAYGMMVRRKTIMPAMPFAATIAVEDSGKIVMGNWNNSMTPPPQIGSLRQNLPPLVSDGALNPTGKRKWGGTANDLDGVHTTRSGVAIRGESTLVFAWCKSCSADALGQAMIAAGCPYGMHLDMNPTHTGFSFYRTDTKDLGEGGRFKRHEVAKGSPAMGFRASRYIGRDVKDFFYLTLRKTMVQALKDPPEGWSEWSTDGTPRGSDGIFPLAAISTGPTKGDLIAVLDQKRLSTQMRRGDNEPDPTSVHGQVTRRTPPVKLKDPAMLIDLGVTNLEAPVGFFTQRRIIAPVLKGQPALVRGLDGSLTMVSAEAAAKLKPTEVKDLRSGPALLIDGKTVSPSPAPTGRHSALGWGKNHLFFVSTLDVATTAAHMRDLGAHTAMLLTETPLTGPRLAWLAADKATGLKELNPDGTSDGDTSARGRSTHLYFERLAEPERVARLELEDVELSKEEARRQLRLQLEIKTLRQELRQIENAKYRAFQEKMKARREGKK